MDKLAIVSTDGHAGAPVDTYRQYLEAKYHADLDLLIEEEQEWLSLVSKVSRFSPAQLEVIDGDGVIASDGHVGVWDLDRRIQEMDREGVAAEVFIQGHQFASAPFFGSQNRAYSPELRLAGARAYNRWQADLLDRAKGRLIGVTEQAAVPNLDDVVAEVRWAGEHGFRAVSFPAVIDPSFGQPGYHDAYWNPLWAACADHSLALLLHVGLGLPQGTALEYRRAQAKAAVGGDYDNKAKEQRQGAGNMMEDPIMKQILALNYTPRQVLWQLMVGGVFDRYPNIHFVPTEARADWVPATIAHMDARFERGDTGLAKRPSEYWATNGFVGASFIHRQELVDREAIGIQNLMFGRDYPHPEGTWPNTMDWLRAAFAGVPENEARMILGENAIRCYGLDAELIKATAERVGPKVDEILGDHHVADAMINEFDKRAGFNKPVPDFSATQLDEIMEVTLVSR